MVCIQTGKSIQDTNRMKFEGTQFFVKSHDEMYRVFKDSPEVLSRTLDIAERCSLRLEKVPTRSRISKFPTIHNRHLLRAHHAAGFRAAHGSAAWSVRARSAEASTL